MILAVRVAIALLCWAGAGAAGWWWHRPDDAPHAASTVAAMAPALAAQEAAASPQAMASSVAAADPMGLTRVPTPAATGRAASAPGADGIVWRLAALVVRGDERYAVLTTKGETPLRLRVGETLPDGDRIKAIHANRVEVQSPRGRPRTLYLNEP